MFRISDAIRSTSSREGTVLLDLQQGRILSLNRLGSRVFEMLRDGRDVDQIAGEISNDFGVEADDVRADVLDFICSLREHNVLSATGPD
jgi:hypothetical protein